MPMSFYEFLDEDKIDYIVLTVPTETLKDLNLEPLFEGGWRKSSKSSQGHRGRS